MSGFIRLGSHEWPVEEATLGVTILPLHEADEYWGPGTNGILWHMEILAGERWIDNEPMRPVVYIQGFTVKLQTWRQLENREFYWPNTPPDDEYDRDRPSICIGSHDDLFDSRVRFGSRSQVSFDLRWSAKYAYFHVERDLLYIEAPIVFLGASVKATDVEVAWQQLCEHLKGEHFSPKPLEPGEGWAPPISYIAFEPLA